MVGGGSPTALQGRTMSFIQGVVTVLLKVRILAGAKDKQAALVQTGVHRPFLAARRSALPLARGSTVIFSLLFPWPAAVTATTQMVYCLFLVRLGIL